MKHFSVLLKSFVLAFALISLSSSLALAQAYSFKFVQPNHDYAKFPIVIQNNAGYIDTVSFFYNQATKRLSFTGIFPRLAGNIPDSFYFVVNSGPAPMNNPGEYAIVYFDARNTANPIVTVYGYRGGPDGLDSYFDGSIAAGVQAPDPMFSTLAPLGNSLNPVGWLQEAKVINLNNDPNTRQFTLSFDASFLQNRTPKYPGSAPWKGISFGPSSIGIWLSAFSGSQITYNGNFLSSFSFAQRSYLETQSPAPSTASENPTCTCATLPYVVREGQDLTAQILARDPQGLPVSINSSPLPKGSSVVQLPWPGVFHDQTYELRWRPAKGQAGSYSVSFDFVDVNGAYGSCVLKIDVIANKPPTCSAQSTVGQYQALSCNTNTQAIALTGSGTDPDQSPSAITYDWSTDCPSSTLSNKKIPNPTLNFQSNANGIPTSCAVVLTVSDGSDSTTCAAPVTVAQCQKDCAGTQNGIKVTDICGVCGGNGKSCLDCKGIPFGATKFDSCGVCGGDGKSCISCNKTDLTQTLLALDSRARAQQTVITNIVRAIRKTSKSAKTLKETQAFINQARALYTLQWSDIWFLQNLTNSCAASPVCVSVSNASQIAEVTTSSSNFITLTQKATTYGKRTKTLTSTASQKFTNNAVKLHKENLSEIDLKIPKARSECR